MPIVIWDLLAPMVGKLYTSVDLILVSLHMSVRLYNLYASAPPPLKRCPEAMADW